MTPNLLNDKVDRERQMLMVVGEFLDSEVQQLEAFKDALVTWKKFRQIS